MSELSRSTLELFAELLDSVQLAVKHPQFEVMASRAARAKRELIEALAEPAEIEDEAIRD